MNTDFVQEALPFFNVTDTIELLDAMPYGSNFSLFTDKIFNPLDLEQRTIEEINIGFKNVTDELMSNCKYTDVESLNNILNSSDQQTFSILNLNARSLVQNKWKLDNILANINKPFSIICVNETWLKEFNMNQYDIPNYNCVHDIRTGIRQGGGVCIFVHDSLKFKLRQDLKLNEPNCNSVTIEIENSPSKNILVTCMYRTPNTNLNEFNTALEQFLSKIAQENKLYYLTADTNIDLFQVSNNAGSKNFLDLMYSFNLMPLAYRPTRITETTATCIDNIFTNDLQIVQNGILLEDISDHFPLFMISKMGTKTNIIKKVKFRQLNDRNKAQFKNILATQEWSDILLNQNANEAYQLFHQKLFSIYELCFPLKEKIIKLRYDGDRPWLTHGILTSAKTKSKLYNRFLKNPNIINKTLYKTYNNRLKHLIRNSKRNYYFDKFNSFNGNIKKTWTCINEILGRNTKKGVLPESFLVNNTACKDKQVIANHFNKFFTNIGQSLAAKIPASNRSFYDHLSSSTTENNSSFYLTSISQNELIIEISKLSTSSAPGHDEFQPSLIKLVHLELLSPLLHIFNLSFKTGIFPENLKLARVTPIFKKGKIDTFSNYRPISVLSVFSKLIEKLMYSRLIKFLTNFSILSKNQFGFQKNKSTYMAILDFIEQIRENNDKKYSTIGITIDYSKAFDTIDHQILLSKLNYYGIRGIVNDWFKSYLQNRKQFVQYNNTSSNISTIKCGVPQGSVLGPLLFLLYINDMQSSSKLFNFTMFADDTNLLASHKNVNTLVDNVNAELIKLDDWVKANKLSLNLEKTSCILFGPKKHLASTLKVSLRNTNLTFVSKIPFLGIIIDNDLSFKYHATNVLSKITKAIGALYGVYKYLSLKTLRLIYFALIYSHINYCNLVWGNTYKKYLEPIHKIQKRFVRLVFGKTKMEHAAPLMAQLGILNVFDVHKLNTMIFMYSFHFKPNNFPSRLFDPYFTLNENIHSHYTRQRFFYHIPKSNKCSIKYFGPFIWNKEHKSIPVHECKSTYSLKKKYKQYLLSSYI